MVFTTHIFVFYFLPVFLLIYYLLPFQWKGLYLRNTFITIGSYIFYGWLVPWFVILMFASTTWDYICGKVITKPGQVQWKRKAALATAIVGDLSLLGFFKYYMFTMHNVNVILELFGLGPNYFHVMTILLPSGISFYTFVALSYTIDLYRGDAKPARNFPTFSCFIGLFPHLIAGPIIRYQTLVDQLADRVETVERFTSGACLFMLGFAKKILLANPCGIVADSVFGAQAPNTFDAWYGVTAYAFQIYFDFCGYSDMAVGLARMLGFEFIKNFDAPYRSRSITEVWRRWHISLSSFLRDYFYIWTLGGNRKSNARTYINLALVMLLGGLWHGANWQFLIWGGYHGSFLAYERWRGKESIYSKLPDFLQITITFVLMLFSWVFFRAENLKLAMKYFGAMFGVITPTASASLLGAKIYSPYHVFIFCVAMVLVFQRTQAMDWINNLTWKKAAVCFGLFIVALTAMFAQAYNPFLYFQF
jgi:alginate O-acetyltransferase complex protein AlgI